jgi:4-hydroxy-tetrahydrodipicolinate synthase
MQHRTTGLCAAVLTPLDENGDACVELLLSHCRAMLSAGCSGIVLLGTTGEANSFSGAERRHILEAVIAGGIEPDRLIVGSGCCAVGDTVELTRHALALGVERVLVLPPFYYKGVTGDGVTTAFRRTIEAVGDNRLRLYLYSIPQLSGVNIDASIIDALLAEYPGNVAGIKDSSGDIAGTTALCERFGDRFDVLAGNERHLAALAAAGAAGCISATANVDASWIVEAMLDPARPGLQERLDAARAAFERLPLIPALKALLASRTGDERWSAVRPPLVALDDATTRALLSAFAAIERAATEASIR